MDKSSILTPYKRFVNLLKVDKQEIISLYVYALFNGFARSDFESAYRIPRMKMEAIDKSYMP